MTALLHYIGALADTHPRFVETAAYALAISGGAFLVGYPLCRLAWGVWIKLHEDDIEVQR